MLATSFEAQKPVPGPIVIPLLTILATETCFVMKPANFRADVGILFEGHLVTVEVFTLAGVSMFRLQMQRAETTGDLKRIVAEYRNCDVGTVRIIHQAMPQPDDIPIYRFQHQAPPIPFSVILIRV